MINLMNETLIHPHLNTKWTVIGFDKGMLECVSEDSAKVEFITKEYGLEMYAEQQKQRADELEKQLNSLKEYIPSLRSAVQSTLYYSHPDIELNLQCDISSYSSLMEQICKELEEDDNA